mmetsp:Transcript_5373/g.11029  ORF Transcript_5373/g.11029 Transcript_5373/m.11029 type:complete len:261 (+) Transcript_5373:1191-1973(+)
MSILTILLSVVIDPRGLFQESGRFFGCFFHRFGILGCFFHSGRCDGSLGGGRSRSCVFLCFFLPRRFLALLLFHEVTDGGGLGGCFFRGRIGRWGSFLHRSGGGSRTSAPTHDGRSVGFFSLFLFGGGCFFLGRGKFFGCRLGFGSSFFHIGCFFFRYCLGLYDGFFHSSDGFFRWSFFFLGGSGGFLFDRSGRFLLNRCCGFDFLCWGFFRGSSFRRWFFLQNAFVVLGCRDDDIIGGIGVGHAKVASIVTKQTAKGKP